MLDRELAEDEQARFMISLALLGSEWEFLSLRDLRVLMAVNSCLEGGFGTINLTVLSRRAVGAWNKERLRLLGVTPLSEKQVRRALERLQKHGLIQRVVVGRTMYAAKGSMPEEVFHNLVASDVSKGKSKRGYLTRDGELHAIERVVVGCK